MFIVPGHEPFRKRALAINAAATKDVRLEGAAEILEVKVSATLRTYVASST